MCVCTEQIAHHNYIFNKFIEHGVMRFKQCTNNVQNTADYIVCPVINWTAVFSTRFSGIRLLFHTFVCSTHTHTHTSHCRFTGINEANQLELRMSGIQLENKAKGANCQHYWDFIELFNIAAWNRHICTLTHLVKCVCKREKGANRGIIGAVTSQNIIECVLR